MSHTVIKPWWQMTHTELKAADPSLKDCPRCGGSGEELVPQGRFASEPDDHKTCSKCHGQGVV